MGTILKKGERFNFSQQSSKTKNLLFTIKWKLTPGPDVDLDVSAFMLEHSHHLPSDEHFIFYNNLTSPNRALQHRGDDHDFSPLTHKEHLVVRLDKIPFGILEIPIMLSVHDAVSREQCFDRLESIQVNILDLDTFNSILLFQPEFNQDATEMEIGKLEHMVNEWIFHNTQTCSHKGLQGFIDNYA